MDQEEKEKLKKLAEELDDDLCVLQTKRAKIKSEIEKIERQRQ